ncbi:glycosyltransferase [Sungkyunkwania multivorans]|uniref:Glycosyltransferase n=1 Tax=Sungkyunkwania multivorans TaxID=1173618 RepID=A0ABW3D2J5_9FLAO
MIPKKLHYCWFGGKEKPETLVRCLKSWQLYCPDYQITEWNETNTKSFSNRFYKNALRKRKYAFVADYVRAKVLFEEGGVYLDTDMLLVRSVDDLLKYDFFIGEEVSGRIAFGLFGARPKHRFLEKMLAFYNSNYFDNFSRPVITHKFSPLINKDTISTNEVILAPPYFYPLPYEQKEADHHSFLKPESYAVHLWDHSWGEEMNTTAWSWIKKLSEVTVDFLFYGYPYSYFKRYFRGFSRQLYYALKKKP